MDNQTNSTNQQNVQNQSSVSVQPGIANQVPNQGIGTDQSNSISVQSTAVNQSNISVQPNVPVQSGVADQVTAQGIEASQSNNVVVQSSVVNKPNVSVQPNVPVQSEVQTQVNTTSEATQSAVTTCPKCGSPMRVIDRCCMKCGAINYNHPENNTMRGYANKDILNGIYNPQVIESDKLSKKKISLIVNIVLFILTSVLSFFILRNNILAMIGVILLLGICFFYSYAMQVMYMKAGRDWWSFFVPFYGIFVFFDIALTTGWMMFISFIPIIGFIVYFMALYKLGKKFGRGGWFTLFLSPIAIPMIAFSKDTMGLEGQSLSYDNVPVDKKGRTKKEINYTIKSKIISFISFIIFVGGVIFAFPYLKDLVSNFQDYLIDEGMFISEEEIEYRDEYLEIIAEYYMEAKNYHESFVKVGGTCYDSNDDNKLYYIYPLTNANLSESPFNGEKIYGYIRVSEKTKSKGEYNYYATFTDGEYSIKNINVDKLVRSAIKEGNDIKIEEVEAMVCNHA